MFPQVPRNVSDFPEEIYVFNKLIFNSRIDQETQIDIACKAVVNINSGVAVSYNQVNTIMF